MEKKVLIFHKFSIIFSPIIILKLKRFDLLSDKNQRFYSKKKKKKKNLKTFFNRYKMLNMNEGMKKPLISFILRVNFKNRA
jgi:hypothetical protein